MNVFRRSLCASIATCGLLWASASGAGSLYFTGDVGFAGLMATAGGTTETVVTFDNEGEDSDASPLFGFSFGYGFPLSEALPGAYDMPGWLGWMGEEVRFPEWTVRGELEGRYRMDSELETDGFSSATPFRSELESWTAMHNVWVDFPVSPPFEAIFGRIPLLEPMSFYTGGGLGLSINQARTTDTIVKGDGTDLNFAYQVGGGISYALTEWSTIGLGYRYSDLGEVVVDLDNAGTGAGDFSLDATSHEFTLSLRFDFYSIPLREGR